MKKNYLAKLTEDAFAMHDDFFADVRRLRYVDFPDHPNVGDSAIALGQMRFFAQTGRVIESVHCIGTLHPSVLKTGSPVVMHGGGNIAGFFTQIDEHRYRIAEQLSPDVPLYQSPQSIHFAREGARESFFDRFLNRPNLRMAVRDRTAYEALQRANVDVQLAPDAAHMLGAIPSGPASRGVTVLLRKDKESALHGIAETDLQAADWLKDDKRTRAATWVRWKGRFSPQLLAVVNPTPHAWGRIAQRRLSRGISILEQGEVVVTDRLHAMIMSLQMGRKVVAIDNNNSKLSKYATTWFDTSVPVEFAGDTRAALRLADRLSKHR